MSTEEQRPLNAELNQPVHQEQGVYDATSPGAEAAREYARSRTWEDIAEGINSTLLKGEAHYSPEDVMAMESRLAAREGREPEVRELLSPVKSEDNQIAERINSTFPRDQRPSYTAEEVARMRANVAAREATEQAS